MQISCIFWLSATNFLFFERKKHREYDEHERNDVVPPERLGLEHGDDDGGEYNQGDGFLDDFQLDQVERASVDHRAYTVGGNHEEVLNQRDAPRQQDDENQRPVLWRWDDLRQFELPIPGKGHKNVGRDKQ